MPLTLCRFLTAANTDQSYAPTETEQTDGDNFVTPESTLGGGESDEEDDGGIYAENAESEYMDDIIESSNVDPNESDIDDVRVEYQDYAERGMHYFFQNFFIDKNVQIPCQLFSHCGHTCAITLWLELALEVLILPTNHRLRNIRYAPRLFTRYA